MLGHSTGRILLRRDPYPINLDKVIDAAAATGTIIELNCSAKRMDMDWKSVSDHSKRSCELSSEPRMQPSIPENCLKSWKLTPIT